ncbi:MAG: ABC transporter permease [Planctomycetota bacterium]
MTAPTLANEPLEVRYSAETSPRSTLHHALRLTQLPLLLFRHRGMLRHFVTRELQSRFADNLLGPLWVLLQPMFMFAVYFVVFTQIVNRGVMEENEVFATYLFSGMICFNSIVAGSTGGLGAIVGNGNIVKKVKFPCEVMPFVPVFVEHVVFLFGLVIVVAVGLILGTMHFGVELLALPWFLLTLLCFTSGLSMTLANVAVFMRDIQQLWAIFASAWFFLSPGFWTPKFVQERAGWVAELLSWNPAFHILVAERHVLGLARAQDGFTDSMIENLTTASIWSIALMLIGYGTFMANKHKYADLI